MSVWQDIKDKTDIDLSEDRKEIHILYKSDNTGKYYVSVPVEFIRELIMEVE